MFEKIDSFILLMAIISVYFISLMAYGLFI